MTTTTDPDGPWGLFRRALLRHLERTGEEDARTWLQVATGLQPALWDDPVWGTWLAWQRVANLIPLWGWVYRRSVGNRVTDAYLQFLANVDPGGAPVHAAARRAGRARRRLAETLAFEDDEVEVREEVWERAHASAGALPFDRHDRSVFRSWVYDAGFRPPSDPRERVRRLRAVVARTLHDGGPDAALLGRALLACSDPANRTELVDDAGRRGSFRTWSVRPDLGDWLATARAGRAPRLDLAIASNGAAPAPAAGPPLALHGAPGPGRRRAGAVAEGFLRPHGPVVLRAAAPGSPALALAHAAHDGSDAEWEVEVHAEAFGLIEIAPGPWFDREAVRRFRDGPFLPLGPFGAGDGSAEPAARLWGAGGVFPYLPARVLVAWRPTVRARSGAAAFEAARDTWARGRPVGVGPFEFSTDVEHLGAVDEARFDHASQSFELESRSPHAMVLGVASVEMPDVGGPHACPRT